MAKRKRDLTPKRYAMESSEPMAPEIPTPTWLADALEQAKAIHQFVMDLRNRIDDARGGRIDLDTMLADWMETQHDAMEDCCFDLIGALERVEDRVLEVEGVKRFLRIEVKRLLENLS